MRNPGTGADQQLALENQKYETEAYTLPLILAGARLVSQAPECHRQIADDANEFIAWTLFCPASDIRV